MRESGGVSDRPQILRWGPFEINMAEAEVRRHGIRLKLQEKSFQILAKLVERPGTVVTREELREKLWADDTCVDFERSLNVAMSKLRAALGETSENPRYVETVRGRGYRFIAPITEVGEGANGGPSERGVAARPAPKAAEQQRGFGIRAAIGVAVLGILGACTYFLLRPVPPPKVLDYVQITRDGHRKAGPLMTDGISVYFLEPHGGQNTLSRVPALGGEPVPVRQLDAALTVDLSPVRPEVLVVPGGATATESESPIRLYPLPSGTPRRIDGLQAHSAIWSPDGEKILYANSTNLYVAKNDGSEPRRLMSFPRNLLGLRWSPTGRILRFEMWDAGSDQISVWESRADGSQAHVLLAPQAGDYQSLGNWTPDGKYYFYALLRNGRSDLWALKEGSEKPVRLTAGQLGFWDPVPSKDGKKLFAIGTLERSEIVRYDSKSRIFLPYLPGISAEGLAFSRDGAWVAYTTVPGGTLWRSRMDGSDRLQLTFSPREALLPRWSPDGREIAFLSRPPGGHWKINVIPATGGRAEQLMAGEEDEGHPAWSPDGSVIVFAGAPWVKNFVPHSSAIRQLDLKTRKVASLPDSDGLWSPRWSPDGKFLVAETLNSRSLLTFEFKSRKWTRLASVGDEIGYSSWSSDSKFVYYTAVSKGASTVFRVSIHRRQAEQVVSPEGLDEVHSLGRWFTLTPEDAPLLLRDTSIREIYSLTLQLP
jgi:Tol biopolymer transport system component/DNA-binding winged helix-turn-helix (wHTH) protein